MAGRTRLGEKHDSSMTAGSSFQADRTKESPRQADVTAVREACWAVRIEPGLRLGSHGKCPVADRVDLGQCDEAVSVA
jgi:hypothetical protein